MTIVKQVLAKQHAFAVIESCQTGDHFDAAKRYVELYFKRFEDFLGYNELKSYLQELRIKSLQP